MLLLLGLMIYTNKLMCNKVSCYTYNDIAKSLIKISMNFEAQFKHKFYSNRVQ